MAKPIGVGIIGLSASGGWGARAHLPALRALDGFEVRGLAASSAESAKRSGEEFAVDFAIDDPYELAHHDAIDLVAICVRVPHHAELVEAVLQAGKPVFCEWPLARNLAEAERLVQLSTTAGVHTAVGLQARNTPTVRYLRDLVADGFVGTVLSTTLLGSGGGWDDTTTLRTAYTLERANGATMLTVPFGHTLDAVNAVLGGLRNVSATVSIVRPQVTISETGEQVDKTAADQVAITGNLCNGGVLAAHYRGGSSAGSNFLWEINGTDGDLILRGPTGHLQFDQAEIFGARNGGEIQPLSVPDAYVLTPDRLPADRAARSVAYGYSQLKNDLELDTRLVPTFADAVAHHRTLDAIQRSAQVGTRITV